MQNKEPENQPSLQEVMNRYATPPAVRGGFVGEVLKFFGPREEPAAATDSAPTPGVIFTSRNLAGQTIMTSNRMLANTFKNMEKTLQRSFARASASDATTDDRNEFLQLAQQVEKDAAVLAGACLITKPQGPAKYQFTLEPQPGHHVPLAKAFASVQQPQKGGVKAEVEMLRFGTERPVIMMRPAGGFKAAVRNKQPVS